MLSKFFNALKPKDYSVQILKDSTSQSAVKRIKRTRTSAPFKKLATLTLVLSFVGGGLASATAATAVTAEQAKAGNIISDMVCISADADNAGAWNGGANLYAPIGGRAQYSMSGLSRNTYAGHAAFAGRPDDWGKGSNPSDKSNSPTDSETGYLTAYEKYGMLFPIYDSWVPVYSEKDKTTIKQLVPATTSYDAGDGKLPLRGGTDLKAGASPLVTTDMGQCLAFMPAVSAGIANMISVLPRFVMGASVELYGAAYGSTMSEPDSVLYSLGQSINKFITQPGGLRDSLFIPFILPLLLIGAIWVGYVGVVKRAAMMAVQSTLWMIVAIALGTVFLAQPTLVSTFVDKTVNSVQGIVNESVLKNSNSVDMCSLPSNSKKAIVRETKCTLWYSTIYTTWVAGQFGEGASSAAGGSSILTQEAGRDVLQNGNEYVIQYGWQNSVAPQTWPQFMLDRQVTNKHLELSEVAWAQLSGVNGAKINTAWAGSVGMISSSILMFFGAGASSAVLLVYGFTLLIYQLTMISAVLMSPFFFLFGIVPNWGRRVLMRYAEILASLAVKRIVTAALLTFYILFYNLVIGQAEFGMLLLKILIIFALALFFITSRAKFVNMFAENINFGGNKSVGLPGNKATAVAAGLGAGLLGGGIIGGMMVANKTRKSNKDIEGNLNTMKIEGGNPTADIKTPPRGPNSGGGNGSGGTASPLKTAAKINNTVKDVEGLRDRAGQIKDFVDAKTPNGNPVQGAQPTPKVPGGVVGPTPPVSAAQGASAASTGGASTGAATSGSAAAGATGAAAKGAAVGTRVASTAAKVAGNLASGGGAAGAGAGVAGGGAGAAVAPAGAAAASGGSAAGIFSGGAAAAGSAGAASGGIAAGGAAAGGAAAAGGGAVAAGAAAGSVVPVVGTVVGAAAAAAAVNIAKKKQQENEGGN